MLLTIKGISADKALAVQKIWPTPGEFLEAFRDVGGGGEVGRGKEKEKEMMVERRLGDLQGRGKVGSGLSKVLAEVWGCG